MNKHIKAMIAAIAAAGVIVCTISVLAISGEITWFRRIENTDAYRFPKYTGEEPLDWKQIVEFNQIPEETLKSMSTDGLIETCLDYPLYFAGMSFSSSSVYEGFLRTLHEFNGLAELMKRDDAPEKLVRVYREASPDKVKGTDDGAPLRMRYLQYIIAQDEILEGLSKEQRMQLLDECMQKVGEYYKEYRDEFALDPALLIAARVCMKDSECFRALAVEESWIEGFAEGGVLLSDNADGMQRALDTMNAYRGGKCL